jgi:hypothetical protein
VAAGEPDPALELIEIAVDKLAENPTAIIPILLGRCEGSAVLHRFGAWAPMKGIEDHYSRTCKHRTVGETFSDLFEVQGIHMDPVNPDYGVTRIAKVLNSLKGFNK